VHRCLERCRFRRDVEGRIDAGELAVNELIAADADGVAGVGVDLLGVFVGDARVLADLFGELLRDRLGGEDVIDEADWDIMAGCVAGFRGGRRRAIVAAPPRVAATLKEGRRMTRPVRRKAEEVSRLTCLGRDSA
jgi:hypothetical protein